jgi:hypothetical protein
VIKCLKLTHPIAKFTAKLFLAKIRSLGKSKLILQLDYLIVNQDIVQLDSDYR